MNKYNVIVVGGGNAGIEAAYAAAKIVGNVLLITNNIDRIGYQSCNPAIGGIAKGQLVKEIDALGGLMGRMADKYGIHFRRLNTSHGAAVRSTRVQIDRYAYNKGMIKFLFNQENLKIYQAMVTSIILRSNMVFGVKTAFGEEISAKTIILTPGTFLNGKLYIGNSFIPGGRLTDENANRLDQFLKKYLKVNRFKTGTPARLDGNTINFDLLEQQNGDEPPPRFSLFEDIIVKNKKACYITYTNEKVHDLIKENLRLSPMYGTGIITGKGVRYCPSIEDKVVKFPKRERHIVFLEPEGIDTNEYYPNGISTSLPVEIQYKMLRRIKGLENVQITRPGYAVEHDFVDPKQLLHSLEVKGINGLFLAGQINGTTGYEEAAAQGLIAGINASLKVLNKAPFILSRDKGYIGVLIDDLVTRGTDEPFRMFTSRVEYRILLREDNAHFRLSKYGYNLGLLNKNEYRIIEEREKKVESEIKRLKTTYLSKEKIKHYMGIDIGKRTSLSLAEILKQPHISYDILPDNTITKKEDYETIEIEIKYEGYIRRMIQELSLLKKINDIKIPENIDFFKIPSLSYELAEKMNKFKIKFIGQARSIPGITPAALIALYRYIKKFK